MKGALLTLLCVAVAGAAGATAPTSSDRDDDGPVLSATERLYGLSLLWMEARYNFAFFDQVPELDWDAAYREFLPRVLETEDTYDYYRLLQRFYGLLLDGHTGVYLPPRLEQVGRRAVEVEEVNGRAWVTNALRDAKPPIPVGSEIVALDGVPTIGYAREWIEPYLQASSERIRRWQAMGRALLDGRVGTRVTLDLRTPEGEELRVALERRPRGEPSGPWVRKTVRRQLVEYRDLGDGLAYVFLREFSAAQPVVEEFRKHLPQLRDARGVILDLRRNAGGSELNSQQVVRHFADRPVRGAASRTREHRALYRAYGSFHEQPGFRQVFDDDDEARLMIAHFEGTNFWTDDELEVVEPAPPAERIVAPVVVLIGYHTASAAEDFLVYADQLEHVTFVGRPTKGTTGQPLMLELPGGGSARVCTRRVTFPDGRDLVGPGVLPDVEVPRSLEEVLGDADPSLDRGVELLRERIAAAGS